MVVGMGMDMVSESDDKRGRSIGPQHKRLRCDCGRPAVTVANVRVGEDGAYLVRLPLCAECLKIEQSYGLAGVTIKPGAGSTV